MSDDGIKIRIMTPADYPAVKELLRESFFTGEPLSMSSGVDVLGPAEKIIDDYNLYLIGHGNSLIAEEQRPGEAKPRVVGSVIAGRQVPSDIENHAKEAREAGDTVWESLLVFISIIEREANIFQRYNVDKLLYSHKTTVDHNTRGKGLGTRLTNKLIEVGREQGYTLLVAYCTSFYSARQKEALGMHCAYAIDYADYKDKNGEAIFNPPEPHKQARIMVMKI